MGLKAKVIATGEIVEINESSAIYDARLCHVYNASELENIPDTDPDYWTRLEHQAAIAAMQGMIRTVGHDRMYPPEKIAIYAEACAHALIEKMKEERK